jgi:hypothetical protein
MIRNLIRKLFDTEPVLPVFAVVIRPLPPQVTPESVVSRQRPHNSLDVEKLPMDPILHKMECGQGPASTFVTIR